jgi:hypothetical protein
MTRLGLIAWTIVTVMAMISLPITQAVAFGDEFADHLAAEPSNDPPEPLTLPSTGPEIAGGGLAGAGAAKSVNMVIVRNVLIGLVFAGILAASALNESD